MRCEKAPVAEAAMLRWFDGGQEAQGVVAIGQLATGVIAIGQLARGCR